MVIFLMVIGKCSVLGPRLLHVHSCEGLSRVSVRVSRVSIVMAPMRHQSVSRVSSYPTLEIVNWR